jgi:glycine cleavage system aminomethyltransferase T
MDDPYSVGLGFAVRLDKTADFIGKQACIARKANARYTHRLVQIFLRDPEPQMIHQEIVLRNGIPVGDVRAASYGHTLGGSVGLAMVEGDPVDAAYINEGRWEVDIAGRIYPAEVSLKPMYDPGMEKIKA